MICPQCNLPRYYGPTGIAAPQCLCVRGYHGPSPAAPAPEAPFGYYYKSLGGRGVLHVVGEASDAVIAADMAAARDYPTGHKCIPLFTRAQALAAPVPHAQAAGQEPYTSERHFALREAHEIKAEEEFCAARPSFDSDYARALFNAGYVRGFDKATELAEARAALAQRQPLTVAQVAKLVRSPWGRPDQREVQLVRETEAACAEAWGVKLGATTGEQHG